MYRCVVGVLKTFTLGCRPISLGTINICDSTVCVTVTWILMTCAIFILGSWDHTVVLWSYGCAGAFSRSLVHFFVYLLTNLLHAFSLLSPINLVWINWLIHLVTYLLLISFFIFIHFIDTLRHLWIRHLQCDFQQRKSHVLNVFISYKLQAPFTHTHTHPNLFSESFTGCQSTLELNANFPLFATTLSVTPPLLTAYTPSRQLCSSTILPLSVSLLWKPNHLVIACFCSQASRRGIFLMSPPCL